MRAAIVGTGFIARVHAIALRAIGVDVVAVAGRTAEGAADFGLGVPYTDLGELLEQQEVDVLHVCTPNDVHAAQALAALERGHPRRLREAAHGLDRARAAHSSRRRRSGGS